MKIRPEILDDLMADKYGERTLGADQLMRIAVQRLITLWEDERGQVDGEAIQALEDWLTGRPE